jgi:uncharacterized membrane protein YraQ (UPF0718 family)/copper chaperone CopZ
VIPVGASLKQHGASKGAVSSFLLSTPQTGVDSILVTYSLLGWVFTVYRVVVAFITGIVGGMLIDRFTDGDQPAPVADQVQDTAEAIATPSSKSPLGSSGKPTPSKLTRGLKYGLISLPKDIGNSLIIGLLVAALISTLFTTGSLEKSVLGSGIIPMLVMMVIAIPMYVCATASVPIAAALILAGVSPGAALVFLVGGPATNAATISTIWKILGRRSATLYLAVVAVGALGAGALLDLLLRNPQLSTTLHHHGELLPAWFSQASAVVLVVVLINALWPRSRKQMTTTQESKGNLTLRVEGMSCSHCVSSVKRALESQAGVASADVSLEEKQAIVAGAGYDLDKLIAAVEELGYRAAPA